MPTYHRSIKKHTFNHHRLHRTVTTDYVRLFLSTDGNGYVGMHGMIDDGVTGRVSHQDTRSFSTYADAYNSTQVINN